MDKRIYLLGLFALMIIISGCSEEGGEDYIIDGNSVYVNDSNVYLKVTPHTIHSSDWVELEFESKLFSGEMDFAFGFDTEKVKPIDIQRWNPHNATVEKVYTCLGNFEYNATHFTCHDIDSSYTHHYDRGNISTQTAYWNETVERNWSSWSGDFNSINFEFDNKDKWYYKQGQQVNAGQSYKVRYKLAVEYGATGVKYDLAIKPSSESIPEAIENNHFYYLDPWADYTLDDGLLVYLSFDDDQITAPNLVWDLTNQNRNASYDVSTTGRGGILEESFLYENGKSVYVNDTTNTRLTSGGSFSIWFNATDYDSSAPRIVDKSTAGGCANGYCAWLQSDGKVYFEIGDVGSQTVTSAFVTLNNWTHLVINFDANGREIWVNGVNDTASNGGLTDLPSNTADIVRLGEFDAGARWFGGNLDEFGLWNRTLTETEIVALYNGGNALEYSSGGGANTTTVGTPDITPAVAYATTGSLNCSAQVNVSSGANFNATLNWSNSSYSTVESFNERVNGTYISSNFSALGSFVSGDNWNCSVFAYQSDNVSINNTASAVRTISDTAPVWTANPNNKTLYHTENVSLQYTCSDPDGALTYAIENVSVDLTTQLAIGSGTGLVTGDPAYEDIGQFDYNVTCSQGGVSINQSLNLTVLQNILFAQRVLKNPVSEGVSETFFLDIAILNYSGTPSSNPVLQFNGSNTAGAVSNSGTSGNTNYWNYSTTFTISNTTGSTTGLDQDYNWTFNLTDVLSTNFETNVSNVTVFKMSVDDCSANSEVILDLTLNDEENSSGTAGDIEVDLTITSWLNGNYSWQYNNSWTNSTGNTTYAKVCVPASVLNYSDYMIDITASYQGEDGVVEFFFLDYGNLSNLSTFNSHTSKVTNLYSLNATDSTSFLLNYVDVDGLRVDDILIHAFRRYIGQGVFREVERGRQNDEGETELHLVEEDVIYYFMVTQNGSILFTSNQFQATCQAVPCSVDLEEGGDFIPFSTDWDLVDDGAFSISSDSSAREITLTFTASNSSQWNLSVYKYNNDPDQATLVNSSFTTALAGTVDVYIPQSAGNITYVARVQRDNTFVRDSFVGFENNQLTTFQTAGGVILGAFFVIAMVMMASANGVAVIIFAVLGVVLIGLLKLVELNWMAFILLLTMGGVLAWKLTRRTN